jgi:hypothetical protein
MTEKKPDTLLASNGRGRRLLGSRGALFAGFGALLMLMAIICVDSLRTLGAFATHNTQIRQELLSRERTLEQVRAGLYESSNIARDYILIDADPRTQEILRTELQSIQNETTAALTACIQSLSTAKKEPFERLAQELKHYWSTIGPIFALRSTEKNLGNAVLRGNVLSQNAEILAITKEVSSVNDDELREADRRIAEVQRK